MSNQKINIFWFRRDLRLEDNKGLYKALNSGRKVLPLFIFDKSILDKLDDQKDKRVQFIHQEVSRLKNELERIGSSLIIKYGEPLEVWQKLLEQFEIDEVYCNRDYEPYARDRDKEIYDWLGKQGVNFKGFKDQVIFEKAEVVKDDGKPYLVFTPYMRKWKSLLKEEMLDPFDVRANAEQFLKCEPLPSIKLSEMGFESETFDYPARDLDEKVVNTYHNTRNFPAKKGTTRLSLHLRFGTISIRQLTRRAKEINEKFWNELIWREFYMMVLYHFPESAEKAIKPQYDKIQWENNEKYFELWCQGKTGYPIVDAGMREMNATGYMHNRVRMVVASFLTKHLLTDWRWGESYFAKKLLDYEMSSNVGGWQWAAGSGCDAAPYFRIFNPFTQAEKFDPDLKYIKKWIPEYGTDRYPKPIVDHKEARERALSRFKDGLNS